MASPSSPTGSGAPRRWSPPCRSSGTSAPAASTDSEQFRAEYRAALDGPLANAVTARRSGAVRSPTSPKIVEALYEVPHLAHAPMEPLNATVALAPRSARRLDRHASAPTPRRNSRVGSRRGRAAQRVHPQLLSRRRVRAARGQRRIAPGGAGVQGAWASRSSWSGRARRTSSTTAIARKPRCDLKAGLGGRRHAERLRFPHRGRLDHALARMGHGAAAASSRARSRGWSTFPIAPARSTSTACSRTRMCR